MFQWMSKKLNQKRKGFTLIELVVVIAILGLLAALAIPRLTGSRDNANRKTVVADLRTIESAIAIATAEGKTFVAIADADDTTDDLVSLQYLATEPKGPEGVSYTLSTDKSRAEAVLTLTDTKIFGIAPNAKTGDTGHRLEDLLATTGW